MFEKDVYKELCRRVDEGENFQIDFKMRSLKIGKDVIIYYGDVSTGYKMPKKKKNTFENPMAVLEEKYIRYRDSRPSTYEDGKYFRAKRASEMTDEELMSGGNRKQCQMELEWYVLNLILQGWKFEDFDSEEKHWFWESPSGLVLLREWF